MDHWFVPVKCHSVLGFFKPASLLNPAHHHHSHGCTAKAWWCLNVHPVCTGASQTWCCCRRRYATLNPCQPQIWGAGSISVIIRCSGCFHMLWHSTGRWCSWADVCCLLHGECQRCEAKTSCGFHALYGHKTRGVFKEDLDFQKYKLLTFCGDTVQHICSSNMSKEKSIQICHVTMLKLKCYCIYFCWLK